MLFKNLETLKKYSQYGGTGDFSALESSLRMVEYTQIIPVIGQELYDNIQLAVKNAPTVDDIVDEYKQVTIHCLMAIGPLFCYHHADKADILFDGSGMKRTETNTNKTAYQEQRNKFKEANLAEGEQALEMLIKYLEDNINDFPEWTDSKNFKIYRSLFIKTGSEFNEIFPSATPYRNYWAMRSKMNDVEENQIRPFLGDTIFDALKENDRAADLPFTDQQNELLSRIKKAIANFTVAFSVPILNVRMNSMGITIPAITNFSTNDGENTRSGIADKWVDTFTKSCITTAQSWLTNAAKYLSEHEAEFPEWIGFKKSNNVYCPSNTGDGGGFGLL